MDMGNRPKMFFRTLSFISLRNRIQPIELTHGVDGGRERAGARERQGERQGKGKGKARERKGNAREREGESTALSRCWFRMTLGVFLLVLV